MCASLSSWISPLGFSQVLRVAVMLGVYAIANHLGCLLAQDAQDHQLDAITSAFKKLDMTAEELPLLPKDQASTRLESHHPEELERGGKLVQIIAALYANDATAEESIDRVTKPAVPVGSEEPKRKVSVSMLHGDHKAVVVLEGRPAREATTTYAYGSAEVHFTCANVAVRVRQELLSATGMEMIKTAGLGRNVRYEVSEACRAESWKLADDAEKAARYYANEFHKALKSCGACSSVKGQSHFAVAHRGPRPITAAQVDGFLDHLGSLLQLAADAPPRRTLTPLRRRSTESNPRPERSELTCQQGAELARSVFDQVRAIQTQANRGLVPLTHGQKNRLKAFLHWVEWITNRNNRTIIYLKADEERTEDSASPRRRYQPYWLASDGTNAHRWEKFPDRPPYRLDQPIDVEVPPPNLRTIVEDEEDLLFVEEYAKAFMKTFAQMADMYYTRGMLYALYMYVNEDERAPLVMTIIGAIPKAGPVLVAITSIMVGVSNWEQQSWDQNYGLLSSIFMTGVHYHNELRSAAKVASKQGIDESPIPRAVKRKSSGDYTLRQKRTVNELTDIEAIAPGRTRGKPPGSDTPVSLKAKSAKVRGGTRFFALDGEPFIPANEEGYKGWHILTARRYGQDSGEGYLAQALKGMKYESEMHAMINGFTVPDADRSQLNERLGALINKLIEDKEIPRTSGDHPIGVGTSKNKNYGLQVKNSDGEVHIIHVSIEPSGKLAEVSIIPPAPEGRLAAAAQLQSRLEESTPKGDPWELLEKLFRNKKNLQNFRDELVQKMEEFSQSSKEANEIAEVLAELRDVPGIEAYINSLVSDSDTTAAGALWEMRWAIKNKDLIKEMQILEQTPGRLREGADFILRDGTVVEVKAYNWEHHLYTDPMMIDRIAISWADQIRRRSETSPGSKVRLLIVDKANIPPGSGGETLESLLKNTLRRVSPTLKLDRISIEDFDYK